MVFDEYIVAYLLSAFFNGAHIFKGYSTPEKELYLLILQTSSFDFVKIQDPLPFIKS